jgi:hypothetical protein
LNKSNTLNKWIHTKFSVGLGLLGALAGCEAPPKMRPSVPRLPEPAASEAPRSAEASPGYRLLAGVGAVAAAEGAGEMTVLADDFLAEGDRLGAFVEPPEGACLLAFARGSEGVDDLDLLAFNDEGSPLAVDEAQDATPALLLCPPHGGRVYLMVRGMTGRGRVALGAQPVPLGAALRVGKALNARGRPGASGREAEVWPGLDEKVAAARRAVGGKWRELRRVALPAEARAPGRLTEHLDAGGCLLWLVTPSEETSEVDGQLLDGEGRAVGRASELGRDRLGIVCSEQPTSTGIELRPRIGAGVLAVVVARSVPGSEPDIEARVERLDLAPTGAPDATLAPLGRKLQAAGYGAASQRLSGAARSGQRTAVLLKLAPGCMRLDLGGGAPLAGLSASLWSEQGALLGQAEGGASLTLFACGGGGPARLEVEASQRPGPFVLELRGEPAPAGLHDLAGGRLLARFNAGGEVVRASMLAGIHRAPLTATTTARTTFLAANGRCIEVGAAIDGGAGVELRLLDATTQEELAHGAGTHATAARTCASGEPRTIQAEVRLAAGQGNTLMAMHPLGAR